MKLEIRGVAGKPWLRAYVVDALGTTVERLGVAPVGAQIGFEDENGPKGGVAVRCLIEIRLPHRPPLDVRHVAESPRLAFDGALERIDRRMGRDRARRRARGRHPKKYYAAKQALAGEELRRTA
jgi:ribosome-associated translation inhibitor RaiA